MRPLPEFLPIFERSGFIRNVDLELFGQVCSAYDRLLQAGKSPVPISFNVSRSCFEDPKFLVDYLNQLCIYQHVSRHLIEFELLESIAMDETERLFDVVRQIKQAGDVYKRQGRGLAVDVIESSVRAYIAAINRVLSEIPLE